MSLRDKFPKLSKRGVIIAIISVVVIGGIIGVFAVIRSNRDYTYGYIVVAKDKDFVKRYNFPGSGTASDPYRIENWTITTETNYGILIFETTSHFLIRNCTIKGNAGIYIHSIAADTCIIENNTIEVLPDSYGIGIENVDDAIIRDNVITGPNTTALIGINVFSSENVLINDNRITDVAHGIEIWGNSHEAIVTENICNNCEFGIFLDARDWYAYPEGFNDGSLTSLQVENNTCLNNEIGIYLLSEISDTTLQYNNFSLNTLAGIKAEGCDTLSINENQILNNTVGIHLIETTDSDIIINLISGNEGYGINATDSTELIIYYNNFIDNNIEGQKYGEVQAYDNNPIDDSNTRNYWNIPLEISGNYWNELAWNSTITYNIDGGENVDLYPLQNPY